MAGATTRRKRRPTALLRFAAGWWIAALAVAAVLGAQTASPVDSAAAKIAFLRDNAKRERPQAQPTTLAENEINAYLSSARVTLPAGIRSVSFTLTPGVVSGDARVDFDALTAGRRSHNPLLILFTGVHELAATGHAVGETGQGQVHIDTVLLDGIVLPRMAMQLFLELYVRPRHPEVGLDSTFRLPARIGSAEVGEHMLTLTQK
jgi:hypothetical protein